MAIIELMEGYQPNKILHREQQLNELEMVFTNYRQYGVASNKISIGVTGSGKTTILQHLIQKFDNVIYVSASQLKTSFKIIKAIYNIESNQVDKILQDTILNLKKNKRVIIIDELNKVDDPKNLFDDLNTIYRETGVPIILSTNNISFLDQIPEDARLTLFFEKIRFPSYNAEELYDIALSRIKSFPEELRKLISESFLKYICAISSKEGSARTMLGLLRRVILAHNFSQEYVDKLINDDKTDDWHIFLASLNQTEKKFLNILIDLYINKVKEGKSGSISVYEINSYFSDENYTPPRISQLVTTFENDYGIISTCYINKGRRRGRYRVIDFVSPEMFNQLLNNIE